MTLTDGAGAWPALTVRGLVKSYGPKLAVADVSLDVPRGSFFGIVGPNGAGKTTTLRMATGLLRPDRGQVWVDGIDVWADPIVAKERIGVLPEDLSLFERLRAAFHGLPFLAEDLGLVTPEVRALAEHFGLPGMRVLQFAFGEGADQYLPHRYPSNCAVYTGTHDNDTAVGWFEALAPTPEGRRERRRVLDYLGSSGRQVHWDLIRVASMSVADLAIFPLQDLLGLGTRARMNVPGTVEGNWSWRFDEQDLTPAVAEQMGKLTALYGRAPAAPGVSPFRSAP